MLSSKSFVDFLSSHATPDIAISPIKKATPNKRSILRQKSTSTKWLHSELEALCGSYDGVGERGKGSVDASRITRNVERLSKCLTSGQQEDSHEFLRALLDTLCLDGLNKSVSNLFDGTLESSVTCQTCSNVSLTKDRYMDLSLDISDSKVNSLETALEKFTEVETLSCDNLVDCSKCKTRRMVTKGLTLGSSPSVLCLHLKRFDYDRHGRLCRLSKKVQFGEHLNLQPYMSKGRSRKDNQKSSADYRLYAILCHKGSTCTSGHYIAYVRRSNKWWLANDSIVRPVDESVVLSQNPYMIFYQRDEDENGGWGEGEMGRVKTKMETQETVRSMSGFTPSSSRSCSNSSSSSSQARLKGNVVTRSITRMFSCLVKPPHMQISPRDIEEEEGRMSPIRAKVVRVKKKVKKPTPEKKERKTTTIRVTRRSKRESGEGEGEERIEEEKRRKKRGRMYGKISGRRQSVKRSGRDSPGKAGKGSFG
ncbi:hypothetical protein TL16_g11930 [Triparma laevis f. inornata]|uniref:ubiquitinyl hydrolase 1 n=1 Tax=Triparma laevis f. inornata TaxID=1714386 RepID=A0A9W7BQU8_9STRA|nr:hypothetical protein TL16_g11930 [Triparma laevis f. inornata]